MSWSGQLNSGTNAWHYTTPTMTTTTSSVNNPNGTNNSWIKAGLLAKASNKAVQGVLQEQAKQRAQDILKTADQFGGTGINGVSGATGGAALGPSTDGEWALGASKPAQDAAGNYSLDVTRDAITQGDLAPAGENVMNMGGMTNDAVSEATSAADHAGQTVADALSQSYGDAVADMGSNLAENAATEAATDTATSAIPIVGTALNVGSNLAQGNYGAAGGAAGGAALGSIIPGLGTAAGATIGGLIGSFF